MESPEFINNTCLHNFYNSLVEQLLSCTEFKISVAFISFGGLQVLLDTLEHLSSKNIPGEIITTSYQNFTQPKVLERIASFPNIKLKIYVPPTSEEGFHAKGYLFNTTTAVNGQQWTIIIGSSNITGRALKSNIEWNVLQTEEVQAHQEPGMFTKSVLEEFKQLWESPWAKDYSEQFLISYRDYLQHIKSNRTDYTGNTIFTFDSGSVIQPNRMQQEAVVKLDHLRKTGAVKALAVAATGTGKTYMSVFDALQVKPKRLLFIVHREDILKKAKSSFDAICADDHYSSGMLSANQKDFSSKYIFASRDTLINHYTKFSPDTFDYIVLDEAHHAASPSYKKILSYFKPAFLLGLTATPERTDNADIYSLFDNNIAVEIRLRDALAYDIICPFHYFGITEAEGINYSSIHLHPEDSGYLDEMAKLLMISRRVDYILEKMKFYGHDGNKTEALAFCATVAHAEYMADEFNKRLSLHGEVHAVSLSGANSASDRSRFAERLEDKNDPLEVIFSVNIFNEGIDIPSINTILMLRPTDSAVIFTQQLGRGLRKCQGKEFVTVLDFIGNYQKSFLMAVALNGRQDYDKEILKVAVIQDFADIPNGTYIHMDAIAKEHILRQLENEKFMSMKYMKESYYSIKQVNGGRIPMLVDFMKQDGSIDPVRFSSFSSSYKTYLEFAAHIESDAHPELLNLTEDTNFISVMQFLTTFLPAKRIYEWVIVELLMDSSKSVLTVLEIMEAAQKYCDCVDSESAIHACNVLSGAYLDQAEHARYKKIILIFTNGILSLPQSIKDIFRSENKKKWLHDLVNYALLRYDRDFGRTDYGFPFFKKYVRYSMRDTALLCRYTKMHSSFRGQGLITSAAPDYFIFVNLYKAPDIKESVNYKDEFKSPSLFQWQTPNSTTQESEIGKNIIHNTERGIRLHLFIRKYEKVENITQEFIYLGLAVSHPHAAEGSRPVTVQLALQTPVPDDIYTDFTTPATPSVDSGQDR